METTEVSRICQSLSKKLVSTNPRKHEAKIYLLFGPPGRSRCLPEALMLTEIRVTDRVELTNTLLTSASGPSLIESQYSENSDLVPFGYDLIHSTAQKVSIKRRISTEMTESECDSYQAVFELVAFILVDLRAGWAGREREGGSEGIGMLLVAGVDSECDTVSASFDMTGV
jgi:hypothetical protein